ncbi:BatD family protein [Desulfatiferula olefinivorans]
MLRTMMLIILSSLLIPALAAAASVTATVDKTRMTDEDILTLKVSVADADGEVDTSPITDFRILAHSSGSSFQWINGKSSREIIHSYTLSPLRKGRLTIPALTLSHKGRTLKTDPIVILVEDPAADGADSRDIFVKAHVNDGLPYVGQQIIYVFTLYYGVKITNPSLSIPDFTDFMVKETDKDSQSTALINGREYNTIERRIVLIPLKPGTFEIPPSVLTCDQVVKSAPRSRDPFDSFFSDPFFGRSTLSRKVLRTDPLTVSVTPLPPNPHDIPFSGLVGRMTLAAGIDNSSLQVGDSATLSLTVSGTGNLMDAEAPKVVPPPGFKIYEDTPEEDIRLGPQGYSGRKIFKLALVALEPGAVTLPAIRLNVFDVEKGAYEILSATPLTLTVAPAAGGGESVGAGAAALEQQAEEDRPLRIRKKVEYTGRDILPIKESIDGARHRPGLSAQLFALLLVLPVAFALLVRLGLLYSGRGKSREARMIARADSAVKSACRNDLSDEAFLAALYRALVSTVFSRTETGGESLAAGEIRRILSAAGVADPLIDEAEALLGRLESLRYGGEAVRPDLRRELLDKTRETLRRIRR